MKKGRELIAEKLRGIRSEKKLTAEYVAEKASISKDTISRYENNTVSQQIDILEKILDVYELDFYTFFALIYANKQKINCFEKEQKVEGVKNENISKKKVKEEKKTIETHNN